MSETAVQLALAAGIFIHCTAARADSSCEVTWFASLPAGLTADDIAQKVTNGAVIQVKALNSARLEVCGDSVDTMHAAEKAIEAMIADASKNQPPKKDPPTGRPESSQMRVFFHRDVAGLASALDKAVGGISVSPAPPDLLVFKPSGDAMDENKLRELKRLVTLVDSPRPEISLNAWSVRVSGNRQDDVDGKAKEVRDKVFQYNQNLQDALRRAWLYLDKPRNDQSGWSRPFTTYVLGNFDYNSGSPVCSHHRSDGSLESLAYGYCLGYERAFSKTMQPSIMNMIGILAGLKKPDIDGFIFKLEAEHRPDVAGGPCDQRDEAIFDRKAVGFECFRDQLWKSLTSDEMVPLARLRVAMADYLFQYKFSYEYFHDLDSYDYGKSAQRLDAELDPLLVAFNHDLMVYLRKIQSGIRCDPKESKSKCGEPKGYAESGIVTVRTIGGTDSSVSTQTQSSFKTTPAPPVQDFLNQLENVPGTLPGVISKNLAPNPADALVAFLNTGKSSTVTLGRDLNLTVSPSTLPGAGSAELKITMESKDEGSPQQVSPDGKTKNDDADRVAVHSVTTNVRVESLKLFEISTLSAELSRWRDPFPLFPPFPYVKPLIKIPLKPSRAYHQSFAIVTATILPTAADLLNGLRFDGDGIYPIEDEKRREAVDKIGKFHAKMLACIQKVSFDENAKCDGIPKL
jgi:hypothetical protein